MKPEDYNRREAEAGRLTWEHITEAIRFWQGSTGLTVDGKAGTKTRASLEPDLDLDMMHVDDNGWLQGFGVTVIAAHPTWGQKRMLTGSGNPNAIVAHYTATGHGTAVSMAKRRTVRFDSQKHRFASWHVSIEGDGSIVQMIPFNRSAWHAGGGKLLNGLSPNRCAVGIELVGFGDSFPDNQIRAAMRVWRAIVKKYGIARDRAMIEHSRISPRRRSDPGPVWMNRHAQSVLSYAYA